MRFTFPPYELEGQYDERSSCWIRVSQGWAGIAWGAIAIPRIGQEVIVEFLEGDPDQPIITGRTYHAYNVPPYKLPAEKTKMSIKSKTHKGERFNELRFEDEAGKEQVFIHAQMDKDIRVLNDAREWIGNERHLIVKKDQFEEVEANKHSNTIEDRFEQVEGDQHFTVKGDQNDKIDGSTSRNITMDLQEKVGMKYASDAGTEILFKSSINQVIEAGASVTLKCGSNFININPAGVFIEGEMVMINSGGAAVSGTGSNPANAIPPMGVIEADDAKPGWEAKPPPPVVALELPDTEADDAIKNIDIDPSPIKRIRAPSGSIPGHWDVDCVKKIFCKNTPAIVTQLRKTTVKTADKIYYDDPYFNGKKWTTKRFEAGGSADSSSRQIMILSGTSCEDAATTLYHEIWHQNQSPSMDWPEPSEDDAYYNTEQWTIDQGLSGQSSGLRKKDPATGKLVPDKKAIRAFVQKEYPGPPPPISGKPQPVPIDADPAGNRTLVREPGKNGKTYWRPSKSGDTFAGPENRVNEKTIDPKQWKCP